MKVDETKGIKIPQSFQQTKKQKPKCVRVAPRFLRTLHACTLRR